MSDTIKPSQQIDPEELLRKIKHTRRMVVITLDDKEYMQVAAHGMTDPEVVDLLRKALNGITDTEWEQARTTDVMLTGRCPICKDGLLFPPKLFSGAVGLYANVCTCSAFLFASLLPDGVTVTLTVMSDDDFKALPSNIQQHMLHERTNRKSKKRRVQ